MKNKIKFELFALKMMKIHSMKLPNTQKFSARFARGSVTPHGQPSVAPDKPSLKYTVFPKPFVGPRAERVQELSEARHCWVAFGNDSVQIHCVYVMFLQLFRSAAGGSFLWCDFRAVLDKNWQKTYRVSRMFWLVLHRAARRFRGRCILSREAEGNAHTVSRGLHCETGVF